MAGPTLRPFTLALGQVGRSHQRLEIDLLDLGGTGVIALGDGNRVGLRDLVLVIAVMSRRTDMEQLARRPSWPASGTAARRMKAPAALVRVMVLNIACGSRLGKLVKSGCIYPLSLWGIKV